MRIFYTFDPRWVLDPNILAKYEPLLRDAGVTDLWLMGYFNGQFAHPLNEIAAAKEILDNHGWTTGVGNIPVGHPGAIDPDNPSIVYDIPSTWRYRIDTNGRPMKYCADITQVMIDDNKKAIEELKRLGITRIFLDDDSRMGNWGPQIRGCFCDDCIRDFNEINSAHVTRKSLARQIKSKRNQPLLKQWVEYSCSKINRLLGGIQVPGVDICLMVMHNGDERHGIDLHAIRMNHPAMGIRVGEAHFSDRDFGNVRGRIEEISGMLMHLNQINIQNSYSETTVFPANALSPDNWVLKARYALALGIPNLFLMGGIWLVEPPYWEYFTQKLPELKELASLNERGSPIWSIHVATGSYLDIFHPNFLLLLNGFPANPVRSSHLKSMLNSNTPSKSVFDILVMMEEFRLDEEWMPYLPKYKQILIDSKCYRTNRRFLQSLPNDIEDKIHKLDHSKFVEELRSFLKARSDLPFICKGTNVFLVWTSDKERVVLCNLDTVPSDCSLCYREKESPVHLDANEVRIISLKLE